MDVTLALNFLVTIPQLLLCPWMFCRLLYMRRPLLFAALFVVSMGACDLIYSMSWGAPHPLISAGKLIFSLAGLLLLPCLFSREGRGKTLLLALCQMVLLVFSDVLFSSLYQALFGRSLVEVLRSGDLSGFLLAKLSYFFLLLFLNLLLCALWERRVDHGGGGGSLPFFLFTLGQAAAGLALEYVFWKIQPAMSLPPLWAGLSFSSALAGNALLLCFFSRAQEYQALEDRQRALERTLESLEARRRALEAGEAESEALRGALLRQVEEADACLAAGELPRVRDSIGDMSRRLRASGGQWCAHPIVDAVAADKVRLCREAGIEPELRLRLPSELPLEGTVLCSLFANILDNAAEACAALPAECRWIRCSAACRGDYLVVWEENPLPPPRSPALGEARRQAGRGLGLDILRELAGSRGGGVDVTAEKGRFRIAVWLRLGEERGAHG